MLVRSALVEQAIAHLQEGVEAGRWPVGTRLPSEPALAEALGVGRSTVREAVRALVHAGLLDVRQGSGTFVRSATVSDELSRLLQRAAVLEVYEVRRALEVEAAGLAARRRSDEDLDRMDRALAERDAAREAGARAGFLAADLAFHRAVVEASHNPLLTQLYASVAQRISRAIGDVVADDGLVEDTSALHHGLAAAVHGRDPAAAEAAVRAHLDGTAAALARLVGR